MPSPPAEPSPALLSEEEARLHADLRACVEIFESDNRSFALALRLLPLETRAPIAALYAFCRGATRAPESAAGLGHRLDQIYRLTPKDHPVDRAFTALVYNYKIPRMILQLMVEGVEWDEARRRYETLDELLAYCVRATSTMIVMGCLIFGDREEETLARAVDLGIAMRLTEIAQGIGEDLAEGRLYLPVAWLWAEGVDPDALLAAPRFSEKLSRVIARVLQEADVYYARAEAGIGRLPWRARPPARAAALLSKSVGEAIAARGDDSFSARVTTPKLRAMMLTLRSLTALFWRPGPSQPETLAARPLLDAAARSPSSTELILPSPLTTPPPNEASPEPSAP